MGVAMAIRFNILIVAILVFLGASPVTAAEKEYSSSLILSGGRSVALNACESPLATLEADSGFECSNQPEFFRIAFNYKFTPSWGVEISGGDLGRAHGIGTSYGDPYAWQMKADGWTVAGVGYLNMGKSFSVFGKLGVVRTLLKEDAHRNFSGTWMYRVTYLGVPVTNVEKYAPTYGVGFQYNFTESFGLRFQYEDFGQYDIYSAYGASTPEKISLTATSLGLAINFQ
jgi:opacity protein-like surface antigen